LVVDRGHEGIAPTQESQDVDKGNYGIKAEGSFETQRNQRETERNKEKRRETERNERGDASPQQLAGAFHLLLASSPQPLSCQGQLS
jgi:hypothetical protein